MTLLLTCAIALFGCADETAQFCSAYEDHSPLESLFGAIDAQDAEAIEDSLAELGELREKAPPEIADEVDVVLETFADTVWIASGASPPESTTIDLDAVNRALATVSGPGAAIEDYVVKNCTDGR
ncbi:MAG: hypothetical protein JJLCMIEE_00782 [Acidimicrobiales bacterium]|nr:MAG: hypothetical protein EDR02_02925 [Actinomycetota bacterium]MBV6507727.1 hypothetical protein [Acidimicrobiales bacterium]RIK07651.1 MAG: hypothetical protein DCC48_03940 [Acidobacteriota bacterium]